MTKSATRPRAKPVPVMAQPAPAPGLRDLQAAFQRAVIEGDDSIFAHILDNSRTGRDVLLGVYQHAYVARLIGILREDHRQLASHLGDEAFEAMARAYIAAHPSETPNARWFSAKVPEFLGATDPYAHHPELTELAALERTLNNAFDAADAETISMADVAQHPPEVWGGLRFIPHPSVTRLSHRTNALQIWMALKEDAAPPDAVDLDEQQAIVVWRHDVTPRVRSFSREEAMMWDEAVGGLTFSALCEMLAVFDDPETAPLRAATYLKAWLDGGMLERVSAL